MSVPFISAATILDLGAWLRLLPYDCRLRRSTENAVSQKYPQRNQLKHTRKRYRVRNWREYEAGLRKRGDLTIWFSEEALRDWHPPVGAKPGGQRHYSDTAIETALTVRPTGAIVPCKNCTSWSTRLAERIRIHAAQSCRDRRVALQERIRQSY
jgi:hypothetical protein